MVASLVITLVLAQASPVNATRDTRPSVTAPATLYGRITEQGSDRPLPGALVMLRGSDGSQKQRAVADASGRYELTDVQPGEYVLWASAGDHRSTHLSQAYGRPEPMDPWMRQRSNLELNAGDRRTDVNIALARALAIEGRLIDPWDEPMANVAIELKRADDSPAPSGQSRSNDRGEFRLYGLRPGRYRVCAVPEGGFTPSADSRRFVRTCYPAAPSESNASDIVVSTSDVAGIEIKVQRSETLSIAGTVQDADGNLVDGAGVAAVNLDRHEIASDARTRDGQFSLDGLTAGRYIVHASVGGPANRSDTRPPARQRETGFVEVDLAGANAAGLMIGVSKGRTVRGRVLLEGIATPPFKLQQLGVQANPPLNAWRFSTSRSSSPVDDRLTFELSEIFHLPLTVYLGGLPEDWLVKEIRYGDRDILDVPTDLAAVAEGTRLEIVVTNQVATPLVRVVDEPGAPAASYEVVAFPSDRARWKQPTLRHQQRESTAKNGVVKLGPLVPGEYLVAALSPEDSRLLAMDPTRVESLAPLATRVTFSKEENRTLELHVTALPARR
jgi:protocatechuate 3,4-dioxygenase beta subunit